ncbi:MAG: ModE family transcriptional regulator [Pseudomonadota bacterium]
MTKLCDQAHRPLIRPRLYLGDELSLGPGKIDLLRKVGECGSISAAARALGIPYKRAWLLIDSLNRGLPSPVLDTVIGGLGGGWARLAALGEALVTAYAALEAKLNASAKAELKQIMRLVGNPADAAPRSRRRR